MNENHNHTDKSGYLIHRQTSLPEVYLIYVFSEVSLVVDNFDKFEDEAIEKVVEFMDSYSMSHEDLNSKMARSKFQEHPCPFDGVQPAVKAALTKAYNKGNKSRVIHSEDMITRHDYTFRN